MLKGVSDSELDWGLSCLRLLKNCCWEEGTCRSRLRMLYDCSVSPHYLSDSVCNLNTSSAPGFRYYEEPESSVLLLLSLISSAS